MILYWHGFLIPKKTPLSDQLSSTVAKTENDYRNLLPQNLSPGQIALPAE